MPNFVLSIAATKTAYDTFVTAKAATAAALTTLNSTRTSEPQPPVDLIIDSDWNTYITSHDTWQATYNTNYTAWQNAVNTQRVAELAVIATLGYNSGDTPDSIVLDQWVRVVGAGGGILTYTNYIAAGSKSTYLTVLTSAPVQAYPLF